MPDEDDEENVDQLNAGDEFVAMLIEMYMSSEITALRLCVLMFWASKGGIAGGASQYALAPGKPPHRYQRKLHRLLGFHDFEKRFMQIRIPSKRKHDLDGQS